jgi:hypothetical protein
MFVLFVLLQQLLFWKQSVGDIRIHRMNTACIQLETNKRPTAVLPPDAGRASETGS